MSDFIIKRFLRITNSLCAKRSSVDFMKELKKLSDFFNMASFQRNIGRNLSVRSIDLNDYRSSRCLPVPLSERYRHNCVKYFWYLVRSVLSTSGIKQIREFVCASPSPHNQVPPGTPISYINITAAAGFTKKLDHPCHV